MRRKMKQETTYEGLPEIAEGDDVAGSRLTEMSADEYAVSGGSF